VDAAISYAQGMDLRLILWYARLAWSRVAILGDIDGLLVAVP
jgi:hypothetical protein